MSSQGGSCNMLQGFVGPSGSGTFRSSLPCTKYQSILGYGAAAFDSHNLKLEAGASATYLMILRI